MFLLRHGPLDAEALRRAVARPEHGAVLVFHGDARASTAGRRVTGLWYEAFEPMALAGLEELAVAVRARHGVGAIACAHRLGAVPVGETAMVLAVGAPHREAALAATADYIQRLKQDVPIWKREHFEDGTRWVGSATDPQARAAARTA